jgi:hypothetical protein
MKGKEEKKSQTKPIGREESNPRIVDALHALL